MLLTYRAECERLRLNSLRYSPADKSPSFPLKIATRLLVLVSVVGVPHPTCDRSSTIVQGISQRAENQHSVYRGWGGIRPYTAVADFE